MLQHWEEFFGTRLIEKQRGRGSRLSPLGEKLLWAEKRVAARLEPQLESLSSEINLEIAHLLEGNKPVLRLHASHGYAVALLPKYIGELPLDLQYCSPADALSALARNACDIAGFHLPIGTAPALYRDYRKRLKPRSHRIIQFITRRQGLMLQAGNPLGVTGLADLADIDLRFINRQATSGTRSLLDALLKEQAIPSANIKGFEQEEFTHSAVAAYIAANMADAGFGVEAAARQFGLDFIPLAQERYVMACHKQALNDPKFQEFLNIIRGEEFHAAVADALSALARNACDIAGFHLPIGTAPALYRDYRKRLKPRSHRIIQFITRRQGLMLQAGNPLGVTGLADLAEIDLRFINRQAISGT